MQPKRIDLPNGLPVLHLEVNHTRVVHCALVMNTGTRDEGPGQDGMAHFIEHMVFRGTRKRKNFHILNYLESVGGDLNAYTTKEKTCLYASLHRDFAPRAFDLLADMAFHHTLPTGDIPKEVQVISEEIDMYQENPEEMIFEEFEKICFPGGRLGNPILGRKETIGKFNQTRLKDFIRRNYTHGRVVFVVVGAISEKEVKECADAFLSKVKLPRLQHRKPEDSRYERTDLTHFFASQQAHRIQGGRAPHVHSKQLAAFLLLNNHLGGPAMNSALSLNIREKYGLTYNIYTFFSPYQDAGSWGAYFACDPQHLGRVTQLVNKELQLLSAKAPSTLRLNQMKRQLIGQITLGQESLLARALGFAKDYLDFGKCQSVAEMTAAIDRVTAKQVWECANEWMDSKELSLLTYLPK